MTLTVDKPLKRAKSGGRKRVSVSDLSSDERRSITCKAASREGAKAVVEAANDTLGSDLPKDITVTPTHLQVVLTRVTGGETIRQVCAAIGIPHGAVYARTAYDEEFAHQLFLALEIGQHSLVDYMLEVAMDTSIPVERARLLSDNIKWTAARRNRVQYGEKLAIDARIQQVPIMLPRDSEEGDGL